MTILATDHCNTIDTRKLETELGWTPAETFETGIRKTVQWYLDNPDWVANFAAPMRVVQRFCR